MKYVLTGIGGVVAAFFLISIVSELNPLINQHLDAGIQFCMNGICLLCGLIVGFGWKILDEIKALKACLPKREDEK